MRVAMLLMYPGLPWQEDWCKAAASVADVVEIAPVPELTLPAVPGLPFAGCDPEAPHRYEVAKLHWRPSRMLGQAAHRLTARRIEAVLRRERTEYGPIDVLHAHTYYAGDYLPHLSQVSGIPYVVTEHDPAWFGHRSRPVPEQPALRRTARLFDGAASVIAVSEALLTALRRHDLPGRFRVVPNPVDTSALPPLPAKSRIRQDLIRVVSVGRLAPQKGYEVLLEALAAAHEKNPRLRLKIIGEGRLRAELDERIRLLDLADVVEFTGHLDRGAMLHEMAHADLFATASHAESFCVVALEALCCGVPVVATRTGALPELIGEDGGIAVPPGDPEALAAALLQAAEGLDSYDPHALAARARLDYAVEAIGPRLGEIYRAAAAARRNRHG